MDRQSATKIIKETFETAFNKGQFINFSKNLVNFLDTSSPFTYQGNMVPDAYERSIQSLERIGKYEDADDNKIDVLIVKLKKEYSLERARTKQRNFVAWYLNGSQGGDLKDAALVAFVSPDDKDWRFSLVRMDYNIVESASGKIKVEKELTPARRYSFLVGENESSHTAQVQLLPILENDKTNPLLSDLEKAFSIEVVTREFFTKYRELFHNVEEALQNIVKKDDKVREEFSTKGVDTINFSKKLLGQIVFLYFLQKKGWFGVGRDDDWGTGPKNFLRLLFEHKIVPYQNFFNDVLEPLFYEALALERADDFYSRFNCKIPFLNGGLFDPINNYNWVHTDILLPNQLFSNNQKTKEGDIGTGILDMFDRYNFTVKEDEPLEKDVAVDPEMLGKVFENLLEVKDRKSKGTYYTPREIVHYMCQESLINYLDIAINTGDTTLVRVRAPQGKLFGQPEPEQGAFKTAVYRALIPREDIKSFVHMGEFAIEHDTRVEAYGKETERYSYKIPESIRWNAKLIDDKLANIRVCDPAIGSGAFPVGLMTEVVRARNTLTTYMENERERTNYCFKRHTIQNCIYGVDIDPGAVEIAKLRLWLSLVVDEEDIKQIQPLPNLDYKIVCGNSLLGVERDIFNNLIFEELEKLKPLHFDETNAKKKQEYKKRIDQLIKQLTNNNENFDFEVYFSEVFHEKEGFDVIIANPPYIGEKGNEKIFHEIANTGLGKRFYARWMDYFYYFFHKSLDISQKRSIVSFITTNYYLTATGARNLRTDFFERATIRNLMNFNELKIFESAKGQHNMITILEKGKNKEIRAGNCLTSRTGIATQSELECILNGKDNLTEYFEVPQTELFEGKDFQIRIGGYGTKSDDPIQVILEKMKKDTYPLGEICHIIMGLVSRADKVSAHHIQKYKDSSLKKGEGIFVLTNQELDNLKLTREDHSKYVRPFYKNSDISKYFSRKNNNLWLLYIKDEGKPIELPKELKVHFERYKTLLTKEKENFLKNKIASVFVKKWLANGNYFVLFNPKKEEYFTCEKIVAPYRSKENAFAYNDIPWYASQDVCYLLVKNAEYKLKYLLPILNSKLYYLWLYYKGKRKGETLELYQKPLSEIPIKKLSENEQQVFVNLTDKIIALVDDDYYTDRSRQHQVQDYEKQIDQLVYQLYSLTPEEIAVVEGTFKK